MSVPTSLRCPSCASNLKAGDLDAGRGLITCSYCGALMSIGGSAKGEAAQPSFTPRPEVALPERFRVEKHKGELTLRWSWFRPIALFLLFFTIAWNAFLLFWYSMVFGGDAPWIMVVFPLAHVAVGVGLAYSTAAMFLNTTSVRVTNRELRVHSGPLPWRGNRVIERGRVEQLYCKRHESHGRNGPSVSYEVWIVVRGEGVRRLIRGATLEAEQALYIEQQVEAALGLVDRPQAGELPR